MLGCGEQIAEIITGSVYVHDSPASWTLQFCATLHSWLQNNAPELETSRRGTAKMTRGVEWFCTKRTLIGLESSAWQRAEGGHGHYRSVSWAAWRGWTGIGHWFFFLYNNQFSWYLIRMCLAASYACCLLSFCCVPWRRIWLIVSKTPSPPLGGLRQLLNPSWSIFSPSWTNPASTICCAPGSSLP